MPAMQLPSGVHFSFFGSFMFGAPGFPLSDVPLQAIAGDVAAGRYKAKPARVFRFAMTILFTAGLVEPQGDD